MARLCIGSKKEQKQILGQLHSGWLVELSKAFICGPQPAFFWWGAQVAE